MLMSCYDERRVSRRWWDDDDDDTIDDADYAMKSAAIDILSVILLLMLATSMPQRRCHTGDDAIRWYWLFIMPILASSYTTTQVSRHYYCHHHWVIMAVTRRLPHTLNISVYITTSLTSTAMNIGHSGGGWGRAWQCGVAPLATWVWGHAGFITVGNDEYYWSLTTHCHRLPVTITHTSGASSPKKVTLNIFTGFGHQ